MIVDGIVGLQLYCSVVTINRHVILLQSIVAGTEIAVVCGDLRIQFDGHLNILYFLIVVSHLPIRLPLQMPELALLLQVKTYVAALYHILPSLKTHVGICS